MKEQLTSVLIYLHLSSGVVLPLQMCGGYL